MTAQSSHKLIFKGVVQGVGFRPTIYRIAMQLGSHGYVLNKGSEVEVLIDTDPDAFIAAVRSQLPPLAMLTTVEQYPDQRHFSDFTILKSREGSRESLIPADTAICSACQEELFNPSDRRYGFPFINCTLCGARFSAIHGVPYDREKTSMQPFILCADCQHEYTDPLDRRYHAQTISCPRCGPSYQLYDADGKKVETDDPITVFAQQLQQGKIGVVKSWGGMHLCCTLDQIEAFRTWYHRPQKAFAVMVDSIKTARAYAEITAEEEALLCSSNRPIVLVKKKDERLIAPGLDRIGLFLCYTGLHYLLFSLLKTPALIMTSANIPGEPMITENADAFNLHAHTYLLHNRSIPHRIDDSVIKLWKGNRFFLRKARGYVPDPIPVPHSSLIASVGAGENVYGALSTDHHLYLTQYLGKSTSYETIGFLETSLKHLMGLTMRQPRLDAVAKDLHPGYETGIIAARLAESFHAPLIAVQHHWAHAVSLLVDNHRASGTVLTLDGLGYGDDGGLWGGEVISCDYESFDRVGHLDTIPLIGGDKATLDPRRLVFGIFDPLGKELFFTGEEASLLRKLAAHAPQSSSFARMLDALAYYLGICRTRTYEGEPAMKVEPYLTRGSHRFSIEPIVRNGVVDTRSLFKQMDEIMPSTLDDQLRADIAYSFVHALLKGLVDIAVDHAEKNGDHAVGVTGGVSYNIPICDKLEHMVQERGLDLLVHNSIPNGDGGIAIGQNVIAGARLR